MDTKQIPISVVEYDDIYVGFWTRFAALLLDGLIMSPLIVMMMVINSHNLDMMFVTTPINLAAMFVYHTYLPKRFGGTPGKLAMNIRIIKMDGTDIGWKEAILRYSITCLLASIILLGTLYAASQADREIYESTSWFRQNEYLMSFIPILYMVHNWVNFGWFLTELIVMLTNDRKRAIHDMIANTVVIKKIYHDKIKEFMADDNPQNNNTALYA